LAPNSASNSNHSEFVGEAVEESAILMFAGTLPLLHTETVAIANVLAGTVYSVVLLAADKSAGVPNLPVAIKNLR
jgi:hypothetical protein